MRYQQYGLIDYSGNLKKRSRRPFNPLPLMFGRFRFRLGEVPFPVLQLAE